MVLLYLLILDILFGLQWILPGLLIQIAQGKKSQEPAFSAHLLHTRLLMEFVWLKREIAEFILLMVCVWDVTLDLFYGEESVDKEIAMVLILQLDFAWVALLISLFLLDYASLEL